MSYFDEVYRRYSKLVRRHTPFDRYNSEADYYAQLYGLNPKTQKDMAWDAFRHAYASAAMTRDWGRPAAHIAGDFHEVRAHLFGDVNEVRGDLSYGDPQRGYSKHMDRWNNAAGRRLAAGAADNDEIADRIHDALKRGDLIIDVDQDARYYTGPTLVPSPFDYDRNRIHERPAPAGAAITMGPSSPTSDFNSHRYYAPYLGGRADIQAPEDHPLSQDEIERIRRNNGIPKGGLF